jgi:hypothetical protein
VKDDGALPFYRGRGGERRPGMVVDGTKWVPSWLPLPGVKGGDYSQLKSGRVMGVTVGAPWRGRRTAWQRVRRRRRSAGVAKGGRRDQGCATWAERLNRLAGG